MHLAVVIVSYNVRDLLRRCLQSIFASADISTDRLDVQVIVVDNASQDGSALMVATEFPQVHLITSEENLGFTRANNLALGQLGFGGGPIQPGSRLPDFVLLLNPDTEVLDDALARMVRFLQDNPQAGGCGPRLHYGDGTLQHAAFDFPGLAQIIMDLYPLAQVPLLRRFLPSLQESRLNGRYPRWQWLGPEPFPVGFVLGAALMVPARAVRLTGLLDEGYFMYCEEMDWCLRIQEAGLPIYAVPAAQIIHHEAQSSTQVRWQSFQRLWTSRQRFFRKHSHHYSTLFRLLLGPVVRLGLAWQRTLAWRSFANGGRSGQDLAEQLRAINAVEQRYR